MSAFDRKIDPVESTFPVFNRKVCGLYIPFSGSAPNSGRHYIVHYFFVPLSYRQRLVLPYADNTLQALRAIPAKWQTCIVLCKTIRSVPRRGFLFYFVKNVDYVEIQIELDGAVEERRTRPVDRWIGPPACLLPQDGCRAERALIGSEGKSEKQGRHRSIIVSR